MATHKITVEFLLENRDVDPSESAEELDNLLIGAQLADYHTVVYATEDRPAPMNLAMTLVQALVALSYPEVAPRNLAVERLRDLADRLEGGEAVPKILHVHSDNPTFSVPLGGS